MHVSDGEDDRQAANNRSDRREEHPQAVRHERHVAEETADGKPQDDLAGRVGDQDQRGQTGRHAEGHRERVLRAFLLVSHKPGNDGSRPGQTDTEENQRLCHAYPRSVEIAERSTEPHRRRTWTARASPTTATIVSATITVAARL